ncbi:hypothetical protein OsI_28334 [Oryza sativa Indica Group]|uniref:Uncharacterized protein n=2 Tax=Oryza TaxID=4527 RepID=A0A0E0I8R4_ORYNI|nr:hypothetical protein OsI_28334 [Oryza sativa Indica Group]
MAARRSRLAAPTSSSAAAASMQHELLEAAASGDLRHLKRLVRALDKVRGRLQEVVEAARTDGGIWALQLAAGNEQLEVCRYLVEGLRVDVNAADDEGRTPLVFAVIGENAAIVKYILDHGADPDKADDDGLTPLHSAAGIGDCEMIEMLLAKGADIDPAVNVSSVECVKLLVEAGADVNSDCISTAALDSAMGNDGSTECLNFLMEAGANYGGPNDFRVYPVCGCSLPHFWQPKFGNILVEDMIHQPWHQDQHVNKKKIEELKTSGNKAVDREDYISASVFYTKAMDLDPNDATLFSNRSLCWLCMGDGKKAFLDALECREMRPDWPKACYRLGAALMTLKDFESACDALFDGFKLDPDNAEIERALREAMESLKISSKGTKAT